jgi:hypothetical protein
MEIRQTGEGKRQTADSKQESRRKIKIWRIQASQNKSDIDYKETEPSKLMPL